MKKALQWIGIGVSCIVLGAVFLFGIPVLFVMLAFTGMEYEWDAQDDPAEQALTDIGLSAYVEHATRYDLTIDGVITAFELPKYDNHVDNTDLRAGVMAHAATAKGWEIGPVLPEEYAALLLGSCPEAAFLLPADVTFDAHYQAESTLAFFDQDGGLFVHLRMDEVPKSGAVRVDKLTVPHNGYVYETETHGGFLGDGTTYQAFIVPETERSSLKSTLASLADWHEGAVSQEEYVPLHNHAFYSVPALYPASDVTFDWWCYVDTYARSHPDYWSDHTPDNSAFPAIMREAGAKPAGNWLAALYDAETGLFIYYEFDS